MEKDIEDFLMKDDLLVKSIDFLESQIERTDDSTEINVLLRLMGRANLEAKNLESLQLKLEELEEKYNL